MDREPVRSSMISSIEYDINVQVLQIEFNSGTVWNYHNITDDVYSDFISSPSLGKYFLNHIRGQYRESRIR